MMWEPYKGFSYDYKWIYEEDPGYFDTKITWTYRFASENHSSNEKILAGDIALTVDDVLLRPAKGKVLSREEVKYDRPYIYTAPMDKVTNLDIYQKAIQSRIVVPVLSRQYLDEVIAYLKDIHDNFTITLHKAGEAFKWMLNNGFLSIGTSEIDLNKIRELVYSYSPYINKIRICIDIAHGHSIAGLNAIKFLKDIEKESGIPIDIMTGSIATAEAAAALIAAGANYIRVGIGGGQMCTTRLMTGIGNPNLSAVFEVWKTTYFHKDIHIIADGGIRTPGDVVKYLGAGASGAMVGTVFAGCIDSPADILDGKKVQRGQASYEFQTEYYGKVRNQCAEGVSREIPIDVEFLEKVKQFEGGIKSATSYLGLDNINDINPNTVKFIKVSPNAVKENNPI